MINEKSEDFGFTFHDESEIDDKINSAVNVTEKTYEEKLNATERTYAQKLAAVEAIVVPFMQNLMKDPEKVMIRWPNRKDVVEKQLQKILSITKK
jgi:hypothetical protein